MFFLTELLFYGNENRIENVRGKEVGTSSVLFSIQILDFVVTFLSKSKQNTKNSLELTKD